VDHFVCELPSWRDASRRYASLSLEAARGEDFPNLDPDLREPDWKLETERWDPELVSADESTFVCLAGNPDRFCVAWMYHALYGRYIVQVFLTGSGSAFTYDQFYALVKAFDEHAVQVLGNTSG
jgi:hypothetical protein